MEISEPPVSTDEQSIYRMPKPLDLLPMVNQAKAEHKNMIRFQVPAPKRFGVLRMGMWGGTSLRVVHRAEKYFVLEAHILTVIEAVRRQLAEEKKIEERPLAVNTISRKQHINTKR